MYLPYNSRLHLYGIFEKISHCFLFYFVVVYFLFVCAYISILVSCLVLVICYLRLRFVFVTKAIIECLAQVVNIILIYFNFPVLFSLFVFSIFLSVRMSLNKCMFVFVIHHFIYCTIIFVLNLHCNL